MSESIYKIENEIRRIGRNFSKDSSSRKTTSYIKAKLDKLKQLRFTLNLVINGEEENGHDCSEAKAAANNTYEEVKNKIQRLLPAEERNYSSENGGDDEKKYAAGDNDDNGDNNGNDDSGDDENSDEEHYADPAGDDNNKEGDNNADAEGIKSESSKNSELIMSTINLSEALRLTPDFDGTAGELHRFINACETTISLLSEADRVAFVKILKLKLKDRAYEIVKYTEYTTFADLKKILLTQFLETKTLESLQTDLMNVKQKYNETETEYGNRTEHLLMDLNTACCPGGENNAASEAIRKLNTRTALRAFQEGLREPLKLLIKARRYNTLKEAVEAAVCEGKMYTNRPHNNYTQNHKSESNTQHRHNYRDYKPKFCSHCRITGH